MEKTCRFTKKNTLAVKGIAISFLLFYHCFSNSARMRNMAVSFAPFSQDTAMMIARCMVHCVGMFAFLSVYGLTLSMKSKYPEYDFDGHTATLFVLKRYVKLVLTFLIPFFFCTGVTFVTDTSRYAGNLWENIISIVMDFFGVGHLFGTQMLVNTWWFLSLEILLIVFMPFVLRFYKKYNWLMIFMFLLPGSFLIEKHVHLTKYLFVVPFAVWFADQRVLERMKEFKIVKNQAANKIIKFIISTGVIVLMLKVWNSQWGLEHFEFALTGLIPVLIIYWSYEFLLDIPGISHILEFLGKHSANVFYIHTFIRVLWLKKVTYSFGNALLIWLFLMGSSIAISVALELFKKLIHYDHISGKITEQIVGWADRTL